MPRTPEDTAALQRALRDANARLVREAMPNYDHVVQTMRYREPVNRAELLLILQQISKGYPIPHLIADLRTRWGLTAPLADPYTGEDVGGTSTTQPGP